MGTERSAWLMYFFPPQIVAIHNVQFGASGGVVICPRSSILVLSNSIPPRRLKGRSDNWARPHHSVAPFGEPASGIFGVPLCCIHPAAPLGHPLGVPSGTIHSSTVGGYPQFDPHCRSGLSKRLSRG